MIKESKLTKYKTSTYKLYKDYLNIKRFKGMHSLYNPHVAKTILVQTK